MQSAHVQEVRPRKDHRSVDLISVRCHLVVYGVAIGMELVTQPTMRRFTADRMMLSVRVYDEAGNDTMRILLGLRIGLGVGAVGTGVGMAAALEKISMRAWSLT